MQQNMNFWSSQFRTQNTYQIHSLYYHTIQKRYNKSKKTMLVYSLNLQVSVVSLRWKYFLYPKYFFALQCVHDPKYTQNYRIQSFLLSSFVHDFSHAIHFPWTMIDYIEQIHHHCCINTIQYIYFTLFFVLILHA